jgi:hypothetical protein
MDITTAICAENLFDSINTILYKTKVVIDDRINANIRNEKIESETRLKLNIFMNQPANNG